MCVYVLVAHGRACCCLLVLVGAGLAAAGFGSSSFLLTAAAAAAAAATAFFSSSSGWSGRLWGVVPRRGRGVGGRGKGRGRGVSAWSHHIVQERGKTRTGGVPAVARAAGRGTGLVVRLLLLVVVGRVEGVVRGGVAVEECVWSMREAFPLLRVLGFHAITRTAAVPLWPPLPGAPGPGPPQGRGKTPGVVWLG